MRARWGALLFGIGIFAVVIAAGCAFYVAPRVAQLPYDLALCKPDQSSGCLRPSVAEAKGAKFLQTKGGDDPVVAIQTGDLRSTIEIVPQADLTNTEMTGDLAGKALVWNGYGTVTWLQTGEMISQYKAGIAIDRKTAAAVDWSDQFLQDAGPDAPSAVNFSGQLYKFPFGTQKKDYEYFDRDLRKAMPIKYEAAEEINGLETYKFVQTIPETPLNFSEERLSGLLSRFAEGATGGQVNYSNTRTIWVEPVSGTFIKVQEQQKKTLVPDTGAPTDLLDGTFVYTDQTIANNVKSAGDTKSGVQMISRNLPIGLAVLGAILLILGLVLVTSGRRRTAAAARHRTEEIEADTDADAKA
ncbi:DUF3068 domain-containing protein [Actinoplanes bogorensis]|uniref:DUF3068 domain-containing protein n=1 Tax=Paractinoplanes bogorensis TaxID=1610840 RepID=A0ABS5YKG9_9ACTN|nr:DUF3068 domain-containing protein [Actinoplanes bogorensis]MBU2663972.1 DUF3068 domain-containing protein [Actinoplanes bogorensis]